MTPKIVILALISIISLVCCMDEDRANQKEGYMQYFKDYKTGLCFSTVDGATHTLACVPCTKEVEDLILNKKTDSKETCK